jgi:acyl-CoA reductase-like NAD-dependent aldehyde dehydrogenase
MITTDVSAPPFSREAAFCRESQRSWQLLPVRSRLRPVRAFRHLLVQDSRALCDAVRADIQKPQEETLAGELLPLAEACRFLLSQAGKVLRPRRVSARHRPLWLMGQRDWVHRRPRGLVGIIGTWNYPLFLNGVQILQALTAGNGVLWKPSEIAPRSAGVLLDLLGRAGYPASLLQMLPATREAGGELAQADIDHVVFTGSSATGRKLAETLARRLISSTLELSGCDALFVLDDADVPLAARAAWFGATVNRGQTCIASRRAFVQRNCYHQFVEALRALVATGQPMNLALESQVEQAERLIDSARADRATVLTPPGPSLPNGKSTLCHPAVILNARPNMAICQEASFAPVLAVLPFDTEEEAGQLDAACPYALGAGIFTAATARAARLAASLRAGMVAVNDVVVPTAHPATPFGGNRASGWGVTQGAEGLLEMTVPQVVSIRRGSFRPLYDAAVGRPPLSAASFRALLAVSHGRSLGERLGGLYRLVRSLRQPKSSQQGK